MTAAWRSIRRRILTPNTSQTLMSTRGFHVKNAVGQELLENVGRIFLTGYAAAAEAAAPTDAEVRLEEIPAQFRGFAYEGAAMAFAVRDGLPLGGSDHLARFLQGRAQSHVYMAYVGLGWAMARLPKFRWSRIVVDDPLMRGLVLDGYGFHQAYFRTDQYVHRQYRDPAVFRWPSAGPRWFVDKTIDQGVGRAMWFVGGTDPARVADLIDAFAPERHEDLYCGAALAATYAGGVDEDELRLFQHRSGAHRAQVAQGAAFAATARVVAGLVVPHTGLATRVLCGITPEQAADVCGNALPTGAVSTGIPPYEVWRRQIAAALPAGQEANP
jgi:hypothetical protein